MWTLTMDNTTKYSDEAYKLEKTIDKLHTKSGIIAAMDLFNIQTRGANEHIKGVCFVFTGKRSYELSKNGDSYILEISDDEQEETFVEPHEITRETLENILDIVMGEELECCAYCRFTPYHNEEDNRIRDDEYDSEEDITRKEELAGKQLKVIREWQAEIDKIVEKFEEEKLDLNKCEVGQVYQQFAGQEGITFNIIDEGANLIVRFSDPETEEVAQFKEGQPFEIKLTTIYGVMMISVKIGNLNWMTAPYSPHLSKGNTKFQLPADGQGLALTICLVDAATGELKSMRLVGLSTDFTRELFKETMTQKMSPFDIDEYDYNIKKAYLRHSTKAIVKMSNVRCKIN